jgi:hypothetical protein
MSEMIAENIEIKKITPAIFRNQGVFDVVFFAISTVVPPTPLYSSLSISTDY